MSTLKVNRIEPFSGSSVEIVGVVAVGGATTGSNDFLGNQTVTGSIDITGEFLVNGTPISGSGGGSVDTSSLATTGSNVFQGDQFVNGRLIVTASGGSELKVNNDGSVDIESVNGLNIIGNVGIVSGSLTVSGDVIAANLTGSATIDTGSFATTGSNTFEGDQIVNGNSVQNITAPGSESQTDFVTVSGVEINGKPYDYTNFGINNYGSFGDSYKNAFAFESYSDNITFGYGAEVKLNGKGLEALVFTSGSAGGGALALQDNYDGTSEAKLQADAVLIGKISGSSSVTGNFVVNTVDTLPAGIPGQIAFQGGNMHVYISGQWNQVQFV